MCPFVSTIFYALSFSLSYVLAGDIRQVADYQTITTGQGNFDVDLGEIAHFGWSVTGFNGGDGDFDGDGIPDAIAQASDYNNHIGALFLMLMNSDNTVKSTIQISDGGHDENGVTTTFGGDGDFNGDGIMDIVSLYVTVNIHLLNADGSVQNTTSIAASQISNSMSFKRGIAAFQGDDGDFDGDGSKDIAVGGTMQLYVLQLTPTGDVKTYSIISGSDIATSYPTPLWYLGPSLGTFSGNDGDFNGDGVKDLIAGDPLIDSSASGAVGAVHLLMLSADGSLKTYYEISSIVDSFPVNFEFGEFFGSGVDSFKTNNGDYNDDGVMDIMVGAQGDKDGEYLAGALFLVCLTEKGQVKTYFKISDTSGGLTADLEEANIFGASLAPFGGSGDINGDGEQDILVGGWNANSADIGAGKVYVLDLSGYSTVAMDDDSMNDDDDDDSSDAGYKVATAILSLCLVAAILFIVYTKFTAKKSSGSSLNYEDSNRSYKAMEYDA